MRINANNLSLCPDRNCSVVRKPVERWIVVFLWQVISVQVSPEFIIDWLFVPGFQVFDEQHGLCAQTANESH